MLRYTAHHYIEIVRRAVKVWIWIYIWIFSSVKKVHAVYSCDIVYRYNARWKAERVPMHATIVLLQYISILWFYFYILCCQYPLFSFLRKWKKSVGGIKSPQLVEPTKVYIKTPKMEGLAKWQRCFLKFHLSRNLPFFPGFSYYIIFLSNSSVERKLLETFYVPATFELKTAVNFSHEKLRQ